MDFGAPSRDAPTTVVVLSPVEAESGASPMYVLKDERFIDEARAFRLAFTCEACVHFCEVREACAVLYPTAPHRRATVDATPDGERVWFCKMFEAG